MGRFLNAIPERWLDYVPVGRVIRNTRFVCCKVPLRKEIICKIHNRSERFEPRDLTFAVAELGYQLGLVVDLTYTSRYYRSTDFTNYGIEYIKILVPGREIPNDEIFYEFCRVVDEFDRRSHPNAVVAVHCTHGVNRTGYFVCRYLVEHLGWSAAEAIEAFGEARGHKIERINYIESLYETERQRTNHPKSRYRRKPLQNPTAWLRKKYYSDSSDEGSASKSSPAGAVLPGISQVASVADGETALVTSVAETQAYIPRPLSDTDLVTAAQLSTSYMAPNLNLQWAASDTTLLTAPLGVTAGSSNDTLMLASAAAEEDQDEEGTEKSGWELGGKVDLAQRSISQKRRLRRKRLQEMHIKMKRGKFWEIWEMQQEKYGI